MGEDIEVIARTQEGEVGSGFGMAVENDGILDGNDGPAAHRLAEQSIETVQDA